MTWVYLHQQIQWPSAMLILVLALVQFTWMVLAVLAVRPTSLTVPVVLLSAAHMAIPRMLE